MYIYILTYVCTYIYTYVCTVHICIYVYIYMYIRTYTSMYQYTYKYTATEVASERAFTLKRNVTNYALKPARTPYTCMRNAFVRGVFSFQVDPDAKYLQLVCTLKLSNIMTQYLKKDQHSTIKLKRRPFFSTPCENDDLRLEDSSNRVVGLYHCGGGAHECVCNVRVYVCVIFSTRAHTLLSTVASPEPCENWKEVFGEVFGF